jgi:hypothetical protein
VLASAKAGGEPSRDRQREQQAVEIADLLELQRRCFDKRPQHALRITPLVEVGVVMGGPHPLVRRDRDDELAADFQPGRDRCEGGQIVIDMLDHVEGADEVVVTILDSGELGQRRAHDRTSEALFGDRARAGVQLEAVDMTELAEHREIMARAAADLEDGGIGGQPLAPDEVGEDRAAPAVPPMAFVMLRHMVVDQLFHQRNTQWRLRTNVTAGVTNTIGTIGAARPR